MRPSSIVEVAFAISFAYDIDGQKKRTAVQIMRDKYRVNTRGEMPCFYF